MIKATMTKDDGRTLVILGLSAMNIIKLKEDKPIFIDLEKLGIKGIEVFIFTGDTEQTMAKQLEEYIRPELRDGPEIPTNGPN